MVKLGPDLYDGASDLYSGYSAQGNFTGFSMLHESGTGGAPKYCVVSQMPHIGNISNPLSDAMNDTRAVPDHTEVGYYKAQLGQGTTVEMAATTKAGIYQYTFPNTEDEKSIVVDVSHVLASYRGQGLGQNFLGGNITVHKDGASKYYYTGYGTYNNVSTWSCLVADGVERTCR
jgi:putative alpha-1,2-mannosidase